MLSRMIWSRVCASDRSAARCATAPLDMSSSRQTMTVRRLIRSPDRRRIDTGGLYGSAAGCRDVAIDSVAAELPESRAGAFLVQADQPAIAGHVGDKDRAQSTRDGLL